MQGLVKKVFDHVLDEIGPQIVELSENSDNRYWERFLKAIGPGMRSMEYQLKREFRRQEAEIIRGIRKPSKTYKANPVFPVKPLTLEQIYQFNTERAKTLTQLATKPGYGNCAVKAGKESLRKLGIDVDFNLQLPEVGEFVDEWTLKLAGEVTGSTVDNIKKTLRKGIMEGESYQLLTERVKKAFKTSPVRANMIAQTEAVRAGNGGQILAWEKTDGAISMKRWWTSRDERVCPFCLRMHGKEISLRDNFANLGGSVDGLTSEGKPVSMLVSYSDVGFPPLHIRCRCVLIGVPRGEESLRPVVEEPMAEKPKPKPKKPKRRPIKDIPNNSKGASEFGKRLKDTDISPGGSTGAKIFKDNEGFDWVVKSYPDERQIFSEWISNNLYKRAGIDVPETRLALIDKKYRVATKWLDDARPLDISSLKGINKSFKDGFAMDSWLANWDVIGLTGDNVVKSGSKFFRVDQGGSLFFRAQGGLKGDLFGSVVKELETMRSKVSSRTSGMVFGDLTDTFVKHQIKKTVLKFTDDDLASLIIDSGLREVNREYADDLLKKLISRKKYLEEFTKPPSSSLSSIFKDATHQKVFDDYYESFAKELSLLKTKESKKEFVKNVFSTDTDLELIKNSIDTWKHDAQAINPLRLKLLAVELENKISDLSVALSSEVDFIYEHELVKTLTSKNIKGYIKSRALNQAYIRNMTKKDSITLYRGVGGSRGEAKRQALTYLSKGAKVDISSNCLSGYSSSELVATDFGKVIYTKNVRVGDIIFDEDIINILSRDFHKDEKEFIIKGLSNEVGELGKDIKAIKVVDDIPSHGVDPFDPDEILPDWEPADGGIFGPDPFADD